ncbi:MAG: prepilin peptidase [Planctomycetota bacterium]|nr:prepilin peptidase [Planctomycetota bacterium]
MSGSPPPEWLNPVYAGVLFAVGAAFGSFLNVAIYRLPRGLSLAGPPSFCPRCGVRVAAGDNLPLLGWLRLGGKCRNCRGGISPRYPLVELIAALLWALEGWRLAGLAGGYWTDIGAGLLELAFLSSLPVVFLVDWDYRIIPNEISLGGTAISLAASGFLPILHGAEETGVFARRDPLLAALLSGAPAWARGLAASLAGALAGLAVSLAVYCLGGLVFRARIEEARKNDPEIDSALGLGDVKLMAFLGAFLGWRAVPVIFLVGSVSGSLAGIGMKLLSGRPDGASGWRGLANRWRSGDSVIPFGPFLVLGAFTAFLLDRFRADF